MYEVQDDRYCYRGTTVLRNRAGLRTQVDLDKYEIFWFMRRVGERLPRGNLSQTHYRAIHRHLFGDVYSWAGKYREVRIAKDNSMFCYPENILPEMHRLFDEMQGENCHRDLEARPFSSRAAHFLSDLNAIHPFREGNGRLQNIFLGLLADQAGHPLDPTKINPKELLEAMIRAFHGDEGPISQVIFNALRA